jgi:hypothetical protein
VSWPNSTRSPPGSTPSALTIPAAAELVGLPKEFFAGCRQGDRVARRHCVADQIAAPRGEPQDLRAVGEAGVDGELALKNYGVLIMLELDHGSIFELHRHAFGPLSRDRDGDRSVLKDDRPGGELVLDDLRRG